MAETRPEALVAPTTTQTPSTPSLSTTNSSLDTTSTTSAPSPTTKAAAAAATYIRSQPSPSAAYPIFAFPTQLPTPPFIDVHGVPNFRSLGGYRSTTTTSTNTITRPNLLYRCAHMTQITPGGLDQLTTTLGVRAIYDLRSGPEVARTTALAVGSAAATRAAKQQEHKHQNGDGDADVDPASTVEIPYTSSLFQSLRQFTPVYATEDASPEALARKLAWYTSPPSSSSSSSSSPPSPSSTDTTHQLPYAHSAGYLSAYRSILTHGAAAYTRIFQHILTRPSEALVFHCTAGKDRTGVFAALVLRLAGVDDETICWEYAITEVGLGEWRTLFIERMSGISQASAASVVTPSSSSSSSTAAKTEPEPEPEPKTQQSTAGASAKMTREEAARVCGSRAGNMRAFLTLVLDGEVGGAERYLVDNLGFSDEEVATIKANLVGEVGSELAEGVREVRPCAIEGWSMEGGCGDA